MVGMRLRIAVLGLLVALLMAAGPFSTAAQTNAERFQEAVESEAEATPLSGPIAFPLEQSEGLLTVYKAGLNVADFVAHASFRNPEQPGDVGWDYGFQFRTTGNNEDLRIFASSDGTWNFSIGTELPEQTVVAPNLDVTPGAANSIDLVVEGFQAYIGINGEFAGVILLPELQPTGDVYASTGFLGGQVVGGRIIELENFTVYPLPGTVVAVSTPVAVTDLPARPVSLISGSCNAPGELIQELLEATYPIGERQGSGAGVVAETSFTRVPILLNDLLAGPAAILVAESADAPDVAIACADLGGIQDEIGGFVIGLTPRNDSGYAGIVYLSGDDAAGLTNVSVFLAPTGVVAPPPVEDAAATPLGDATQTPEAAAATPEPTPVSVIEVEAAATPAA